MIKCPMCKGDGGEWNAVLWRGIGGGPWESCMFCGRLGYVKLSKWLKWWLIKITKKGR